MTSKNGKGVKKYYHPGGHQRSRPEQQAQVIVQEDTKPTIDTRDRVLSVRFADQTMNEIKKQLGNGSSIGPDIRDNRQR